MSVRSYSYNKCSTNTVPVAAENALEGVDNVVCSSREEAANTCFNCFFFPGQLQHAQCVSSPLPSFVPQKMILKGRDALSWKRGGMSVRYVLSLIISIMGNMAVWRPSAGSHVLVMTRERYYRIVDYRAAL